MNGNRNGAQYMSRKWKLILMVVIFATIGAFLPPLISAWLFGADKPLIILSGTEWVSIITISVGAYFGANVWQKHVEKRPLDPEDSGAAGDPVPTDPEDPDAGKEA